MANTTITLLKCHNCNIEFDTAEGFDILWGGETICTWCADISQVQD